MCVFTSRSFVFLLTEIWRWFSEVIEKFFATEYERCCVYTRVQMSFHLWRCIILTCIHFGDWPPPSALLALSQTYDEPVHKICWHFDPKGNHLMSPCKYTVYTSKFTLEFLCGPCTSMLASLWFLLLSFSFSFLFLFHCIGLFTGLTWPRIEWLSGAGTRVLTLSGQIWPHSECFTSATVLEMRKHRLMEAGWVLMNTGMWLRRTGYQSDRVYSVILSRKLHPALWIAGEVAAEL